ncbi:MAG: hypothetical protein VCA55_04265 [Verrucomicrobiales bacterium]
MEIKKKKLVLLNLLWATTVVIAFLLGGKGDDADVSSAAGKVQGNVPDRSAHGVISALGGAPAGNPTAGSRRSSTGSVGSTGSTAGQRMASALADRDPLRRNLHVAELLSNLTTADIDGVLAIFENGPRNEESNRHFREFLYAWALLEGEDAVAYAMDSKSPRMEGKITSAIKGWATRDPEGAKQYVAGVKDSGTRQWMHLTVMGEMLHRDLDGAILYSEQNEKSRARGSQLDQLASALFEQRGVRGITDWINGIDHTRKENDMLSYKSYAAGLALDRLADDDPEVAMQFIMDNADQPFITSDGLERAARRAAGPINEELEWLAQLPAEVAGQRHAIGERFEDYIREDFASAGKWLASRPLGPAYDEAIQDYAFSAARDNRAAAIAWAEKITDPDMKGDTLRRLAPRGSDDRG